jgi:metal-responsive CopG/Arc/MetJ family transcriptional regulator
MKNQDKAASTSISLPLSFPARIDEAAEKLGVSRSQLVRRLITEFLEEFEAAEAKTA